MIKKIIEQYNSNQKYVHYLIIMFGCIFNIYVFRMECVIMFVLSISNYILTINLVNHRRFYLIIHSFNFLQIVLIRYFELNFSSYSDQLQNQLVEMFGGSIVYYYTIYNLTILKQVSFSLEYYYLLNQSKNKDFKFLMTYQKDI